MGLKLNLEWLLEWTKFAYTVTTESHRHIMIILEQKKWIQNSKWFWKPHYITDEWEKRECCVCCICGLFRTTKPLWMYVTFCIKWQDHLTTYVTHDDQSISLTFSFTMYSFVPSILQKLNFTTEYNNLFFELNKA
jgi:hypothetical protein